MEAQGMIVPVVLCMPAIISILILYVRMYVYVTRDLGNSVFEIVQYLLPCTYIFIFLLLCLLLLRYPLSGGEASFSPADNLFTTLRVTLAAPDVVAIRNDSSIATVRSDTFLALSLGAVADFSGNLLDVATSPVIMAARYVCNMRFFCAK